MEKNTSAKTLRKRVQLRCVISVIAENKRQSTSQGSFAYKESRHDSYPHARSPLGRLGACPPFRGGQTKNKGLHFERTRASIYEMPAPILCFEII